MSKESEKYFIASAHALQPQRTLYHDRFSSVMLDPQGINWTDKACEECYKPLAIETNTLDPRLKFSTDWYGILRMQIKDKNIKNRIIGSLRVNGMGDSFIHPILPFLDDDDKNILIGAGKAALERENIKPVIFWAPESALDWATLNTLRDFDYKAILLAPHQVRRSDGMRTDNCPLRLKNGLIAIPFDQKIHDEVSFGDIRNADDFTKRVVLPQIEKSPRNMVIGHTDIETYGHHRRWGNVFIDYTLRESVKNHGIEVLSLNDVVERVEVEGSRITQGELVENTSWSCLHGLDRWNKSCRCVANGSWKTNFLGTFIWFNDKIKNVVLQEFAGGKEKIDSILRNNFEDLLKNPGGNSSDKDFSLLSARVDGLCVLQSCSTFHGSPGTAGWGSVGLGLEAIEHLRDAGLNKRASELEQEYFNKLEKINIPAGEKKLSEVARSMIK